jgi:hypothetical protein
MIHFAILDGDIQWEGEIKTWRCFWM